MKKRGILLSLIGMVIVSVGLMLIVSRNTKKVIMQDGAMLALTLDGSSITEFPSSTNYRVEIDCTNGRGKVLPEDGTWKFSVDNIEGNIKCNIDFYSRTENDTLINTVQSAEGIVNEEDAGYRYEGTNPNNYIWFNNEMWRIIGLIPTKVDASGTTTNLVKIIRKDSLGGIAYDAKSSGYTGAWGSNTLYALLNNYYYGDKSDVTNEAVCSGYSNNSKAKCDYSLSGISSAATDYYGRMVKNVYWNTGASDNGTSASEVYATEKAKQTVQGRIGLMSASDYGYAASSTNHNSTKLNAYGTSAVTSTNWLYNQGYEWTNTQSSSSADFALYVIDNGDLGRNRARYGFAYRPVVYLSAEVYVISGSGTILDPYIIGM